jgi:ATP-dependent RNA helicase DDX23/PRP28
MATEKPRRGPLDLEELLRKKREADSAAAKPRFIPKKERERMEAERKAKEESELKRKEEERLKASEKARRETFSAPSRFDDRRDYRRDRDRDRDRVIPTGPKAMRAENGMNGVNGHPATSGKGHSQHGKEPTGNSKRNSEQAELELVRTRYMGPDVNQSTFSAKKKRRRTTEKKFNFDWDPDEDTSRNYEQTVGPTFFGAGRQAGFGEEAMEENIRRYARGIEEMDPENGRERARQILEQYERGKERRNRGAIGKHWSEKPLEEMRERDWRIFKENFGIATKGGGIPNPMRTWRESDLPSRLLDIVEQVGYEEPTPIQRAAIPIALQARDLIGVAVTGSGKTAAFLLPLLVYIKELPPLDEYSKNDGPYALILAPTRELAQQIENEAKKFATPFGYTVVSIVGGHSLEEQAFALRNGAEIIVATPGRLVDCIERRLLVLSQCCYIIMDEADRMIDLGFEESLNKILDALPVTNEKPDTEDAENAQAMTRYIGGKNRYRQTMMYTATMPPLVEKIARRYLRRPATVTIGNVGEAVETVEQRVEFVSGEDKRKKRLQEILNSGQFAPPIIVFVNIKRNCDMVAKDIRNMGYSTVTLHGSKTQEQREAALASVRERKTDILVATDLAGRGIDVADVSLVVNFNMAMSIDSYTHRIGRTGRAGKSGVAITFLGNEDTDVLYDLKQMISKSSISKLPDELRRHEAAQQKPSRSSRRAVE